MEKKKASQEVEHFNIGKSKAIMKETLYDITIGKSAGFFAMPGGKRDKNVKIPLPGVNWNAKGLDRENAKRILYNRHLIYLDPLYTSLRPMQGVLVRTFIREADTNATILKLGVEPSSLDKVDIMQQQQQHIVRKTVDSPFKFRSECIVVAVNAALKDIKVGDIYAYNPLRTVAPVAAAETTFTYNYNFVHPSSQLVDPPKWPDNRHYGYLMLPLHELRAYIEHVETFNEFKDFTEEVEILFRGDQNRVDVVKVHTKDKEGPIDPPGAVVLGMD